MQVMQTLQFNSHCLGRLFMAKHIRKSLYVCKSCPKEWIAHTDEERTSSGLCQWWSLDTQTVCMLLLPCNLHPGRGHAAIAHWRDPNAPVRLSFIEEDHRNA